MSTYPDVVPYKARLDAAQWWDKHKDHVERLVASKDDGDMEYPPSGSDQFHPELWRAPHWRWFVRLTLLTRGKT